MDTTLAYTLSYDGTVAANYYRAMREVEQRFSAPKNSDDLPMSRRQLLALVDALRCGTLNEKQQGVVQALRLGLLRLGTA